MALRTFPNGLAGTTDALLTASNFYIQGTTVDVYYVDSVTGDTGNSGLDRDTPKATLGQALSAIGANNDNVIVLMSGHTEELASVQIVSSRVVIIGEGTTNGVPAATLIMAHANNNGLSFQSGAEGSELRNVRFRSGLHAATPTANTGNMVDMWASHLVCDGCYFDMTANTDGAAVSIRANSDGCRVSGCSFVVTDGAVSREGILANSADFLELSDLVFDAGQGQFVSSVGAPTAVAMTGTNNGIRVRNMSFLRGAGMDAVASGYYASLTGSENPRVSF